MNESVDFVDVPLLTGDEVILDGLTVRDFWAWALGDLRLNANRGMLAQFLVAKVLQDPRPRDDGWGDFDVLSAEGIKVEVKSSGYLQSWRQSRPSNIVFSGLKGRSWTPETGRSPHPEFRADVYVFAVHTCQTPDTYDPLDIRSWEFFVLPVRKVRELGQNSIQLSRLGTIAPAAVHLENLRAEVLAAYQAD